MENEPERPIEKWLRRSAAKRRSDAGGPFELHPATRRLLQSEVSSVFRRGQDAPRRSWLSAFGPRLAFAAFAVLAVSLVLFSIIPGFRHKPETLLAKQESLPIDSDSPAVAMPPAESKREQSRMALAAPQIAAEDKAREPAASPAVARPYAAAPKDESGKVLVVGLENSAAVAPGARPEGQARVGGNASSNDGIFTKNAPAASANQADRESPPAQAFAGGAPPPLRPMSTESPATASGTDAAIALRQSRIPSVEKEKSFFVAAEAIAQRSPAAQDFVRANLANSIAKPAASPAPIDRVLASFKLEQNGEELRAIDQDGSVYKGGLQLVGPVDQFAERKLNVNSSRGYGRTRVQSIPLYSFQLAGTNRSLNQRVVFTGTLLLTNLAEMPATGLAAATQSAPILRQPPGLLPLSNSRVSGKVLVGDTQSVEINAVPAKP